MLLRVLDTKGINVILGMDTLAKWGVRIDGAHQAVHLTASDGQGVTVSATEPSGFLHQMELDPRMVFAWCLNSRMSFRKTCQKKEEELMKTYPDPFASQPRISGQDSCKGVGFVTP